MSVPINYPAVLVAALAQVFLAFIWYGPLFGKKWASLQGVDMTVKPSTRLMARNMTISTIGSLLMSWTLAHALVFANAFFHSGGPATGAMGGWFNWLGFIAPVTIGPVLWEGKPWLLWIITSGYYFVSLVLMGIILASWA